MPTTGEVGIIYLVPRENIDPPEEETFITWIEYIWSEDNQIFMQPEELGMSWIDFMDYEYLYMVSLPETGVAHKLYLIPDNAPPTPEPEEEEV